VPRLVALLLAVALVASGCGDAPKRPSSRATASPTPSPGSTVPASTGKRCDGVGFRDVRGRAPSYGARELRRFPARRYACHAMWLPHLEQWFVPQSLALDGDTAWVSGYTWHRHVADRACRLVRVRLATGKVLADQGRLVGAPGDRKPTFCRHGGGLVQDGHGLWIAEKERLWLVDPAKVGTRQQSVLRVWGIRKPIYGSTAVLRGDRIGLAHFRRAPRVRITWFRIDDLLAPGVLDLEGVRTDPSQVAPVETGKVAGSVQGMTYRPGHDGLLISAYRRGCGVIVTDDGSAIDVMPGIEDFEFTRDNRLWVVSESSSRVYQRKVGPLTPMLTEYDARQVMALPKGDRCHRS
jgi:hypothetical protein